MFNITFQTDEDINVNFNASNANIGTGFGEVNEVHVFDNAEAALLTGKMTVAAPALTKRVADGTQLMNPLWVDMACAPVGYFHDTDANRLRLYFVFSAPPGICDHFKTIRMTDKGSTNPPFEFTPENAPTATEISADDVFKYRVNVNIDSDPFVFDIRFCRILYNADNVELGRIYSAQYRYTITSGVASRQIVQTEPQDSKFVVDIGLVKAENSVRQTFNFVKNNVGALLPIVHTNQPAAYYWIVPDALFENASFGLSVVVATGNGMFFVGPTFDKEPE